MFHSDITGNGKTFEIMKMIQNNGIDTPFECFQISPTLEYKNLQNRFIRILNKDSSKVPEHIIFQIEMLEKDNEENMFKLNKILFNLAYYKILEFDTTLYVFNENTKIYIEVSNSTKENWYNRLNSIHYIETHYCTYDKSKIVMQKSKDCLFFVYSAYMLNFVKLLSENEDDPIVQYKDSPFNKKKIHKFKISNKEMLKEIKEIENNIKNMEVSVDFKISYRFLEDYLKLAVNQLQKLKHNEVFTTTENLKNNKLNIIQLILKICLEIVYPSQEQLKNQNRAMLIREGGQNTISKETEKNSKVINWGDLRHAYIFSGEGNLSFIYTNLNPEKNKTDKIIHDLFKPKQNKGDVDIIDATYVEYLEKFENKVINRKNYKEFSGLVDLKKIETNEKYLWHNLLNAFEKSVTEDINNMRNNFKNKGKYILTLDNYIKIILIHNKMISGLPVILMGETGCGKTYLLEFYSEVLRKGEIIFNKFVMHDGIEEDQLSEYIEEKIQEAKDNKNKEVWIFFDEINTSSFEKMISTLFTDRKFYFGKSNGKINLFYINS